MEILFDVLVRIIVGFLGGYLHYLKMRFVDYSTDKCFKQYLLENRKATYAAAMGIISAEYGLSLTDVAVNFTFNEFVGALAVGYNVDNVLNKS